jgi:hypothetical protein
VIFGKLAESGEEPQDLLDVHDFIRFTLKTKPPASRAKASKAPPAPKAAESSDDDSAEESSDDGD